MLSCFHFSNLEMEQVEHDPDFIMLSRQFKATAMELISVLEQKQSTGGRTKVLLETVPVHKLADIFVASFEISFEEQLSMLDSVDAKVRLSKATELVDRHLQASYRVNDASCEMKAIKEELGDNDDEEDDLAALERKMQSAGMPQNTWKLAIREFRRLKKMQPQQPGYSSSRAYLELLSDLPWQKASKEHELDLRAAQERLDNDHYGLVKVKQRIIEYLAVRKLKPDARGPVLCFVGPPGVGKTSLASSIAAALDRKFVRISLGGVKDEADIRGHRRTYIGSMPGRLIDGLKKVAVCNPVMLLDEIDKTGSDVRGDPASALLEVLDPEQNKTFNDQAQPIPPPLLDRMEVIELPGYTPEEKLKIAMRHLIPRVLDQHGLSSEFLQIPKAMVQLVIQRYTREAGVRSLERNLAALARAAAVRVAEQEQVVPLSKGVEGLSTPLLENRLVDSAEVEMEVIPMGVNNRDISNTFRITSPLVVDETMVEKVLGPPKFDGRETAERVVTPGICVGLVWTTFGGEVQFVEASTMVGKGELHLTGQLGDVIKESAQIALTWVRARAADLKLTSAEGINLLEGRDIHIHFPAGAIPKDGPSAGVTLVTALVSLFSKRKVRSDTAMTGEMTLRGLVLPVGGIKDKILAAHRYGIKRVILPEKNLKDLVEVPPSVLANLEILLAKRMEDVLEQAFDSGCPWRQNSKL
ncbi:ion protease peroxisomal-like [Trifolium pratense]|uniref:Lon protease homolog n=1 Tax=Trifolium pratense TaxID=57577 RepID=A0A2K3P087_TRIPR|nr:ion protease peroxisomal-like [Trifolium pratense]